MAVDADMREDEGVSRNTKIMIGVIAAVVIVGVIALAVWWFQPTPSITVRAEPMPEGRTGVLITVSGEHFPPRRELYVGLTASGFPPSAGTSFVTTSSDKDGKIAAAFPYPADPNWVRFDKVTVYAGTPEGDAVATYPLALNSFAWMLVPSSTPPPPPTVTPLPTPSATASLTPVPVPVISLQPASGRVGTMVTVTGRGWRPSELVNLSVSSYGAIVGAVNVDAQGNFTGYFPFPRDYVGPAVTTVIARNQDGSLQASAVFQVVGLATPTVPSPTPLIVTGWLGQYYANPSLLGDPTITRDDASINFDWGSAPPAPGLPNEHWSARWTRTIYFAPGNYRFYADVDDGVRIWFDGQRIMDEWHPASGRAYMSDVYNVGEGLHAIKVEYYQDFGPARARVWWQQIVPPTVTPTPTPTTPASPTPTQTPTPTVTATTTPSPTPGP